MAQPYTARQLDFFKNTLKILESAIFEAVLSASEAETLTEMPLAITVATTPAIDSTVVKDLSPERSSIFFAMPEPVDSFATAVSRDPVLKLVHAPIAVAVTARPEIETSTAFFRSLPWHDASTAATRFSPSTVATQPVDDELAAEIMTATFVTAVTNAKKSGDFFRLLPWKASRSSVIAKTQAVVESVTSPSPIIPTVIAGNTDIADNADTIDCIPVAAVTIVTQTLPEIKSCSVFFRSLPWYGANFVPVPLSAATILDSGNIVIHAPLTTATAISSEIIAPTAFDQNIIKSSAGFFHTLPWQGSKKSTGETDFISAMNSNDFSAIASLATQTALQAAQRGNIESDVIPTQFVGKNTASGFFQTLPW
jgi:hypothetical protein